MNLPLLLLIGVTSVIGNHDDKTPSNVMDQVHAVLAPQNPHAFLLNVFGNQGLLSPTFDLFHSISHRKTWWQGPNVCEETTESKDDDKEGEVKQHGGFLDLSMQSCQQTGDVHECKVHTVKNGVKTTVTHKKECCHGFSVSDENVCEKINMENMKETIKNYNGTEFLELAQSKSLNLNNSTVFLPSDEALRLFESGLQGVNDISYKNDNRKKNNGGSTITIIESPGVDKVLKAHITNGFVKFNDVTDEMTLPSRAQGSSIRMTVYNTFPEKTWFANCAKVITRDIHATNGIVHKIDEVLRPVTNSLADTLASDEKFTTLVKHLKKTGLLNVLGKIKEGKGFTIFAPTNEAFEALPAKLKTKLNAGGECAKNLLQFHVLPNVICSKIVDTSAKTFNMLDSILSLNRNKEGVLEIEKEAVVNVADVMATNGVIHVIDKVLVPEGLSSSLLDALDEETHFKELFEKAKLLKELEGMDDVTMFVPTQRAMEEVPKEVLKAIKEDPEKLREFLMYHIGNTKTSTDGFINGQSLPSNVKDKHLRINSKLSQSLLSVRRTPLVQCIPIKDQNEFCGGVVHKINHVLMPPSGNLESILNNNEHYSKFKELLKKSKVDMKKYNYTTIYLPTNSAFDSLPEKVQTQIKETTPEEAEKIVLDHLRPGSICCTGSSTSEVFAHRFILGLPIPKVLKCDLMADDGVIHEIDRLILPREMEPRGTPQWKPFSFLQEIFDLPEH